MYSVEVKKVIRRTGIGAGVVGALGAAVLVGTCIGSEAGVKRGLRTAPQAIETPTPSAAAGTPTPKATETPTVIPTKMPEATATPTVLATPTAIKSRVDVDVNINVGVGVKTPEPTATPRPTKTPTPRPTPTATTKPESTPEAQSSFTFKKLSKGDVWFAQPGDIVVGDLEINDQALYDQKEDTGVITISTRGGKITAIENAGDIIHPKPGADINQIIEQQKRKMLEKNPQIKIVTIQVFPGQTQSQVAEPAPTVITATPRPTPTEMPRPDLGRPINFNRGETRTVSGKTVVSGDVKVNGERLFDDLAETAAISVVIGTAEIEAPFGASGLTDFRTDSGLDRETKNIVRQKLTGGFREVTVNTIQNGKVIGSRTFTREDL